jgi:hypothetical protein
MSLLGYPVPKHRDVALARVGAIVDEPRFHSHLTGRQNLRVLAARGSRQSFADYAKRLPLAITVGVELELIAQSGTASGSAHQDAGGRCPHTVNGRSE